MYDIVIIGCGVIGALTARELSGYKLNICALEALGDVAMGATSANSGIVHAGYDAAEGSLKGKYNMLGNRAMKNTCKQLGVKCKNIGSLVVSFNEKQEQITRELFLRGQRNGVSRMSLINKEKLKGLEPNISPKASGALLGDSASIVCPYTLAIAAMGNAMDNGADLKLNFKVVNILKQKDNFIIESEKHEKVEAKYIVNAAGLYSDKIAAMLGDKSFKIGARKGEYLLLDKDAGKLVSHTLFSCPSEKGKGVLISPTVDGNIILGPTSEESDTKDDNSTSNLGFDFIKENALELVENIPFSSVITSFCGIRAFSDRHDFIIEQSKIEKRLFNIAGIESPGLTSAPAIASYVSKMVVDCIGNVKSNLEFNPIRKSDSFFEELSLLEKNELIKRQPEYGNIICRCEGITLGEILFSLSRNPRPKTIDALKKRTRAGMGRCQGGFCQPSVAKIIKDEFKINYEEVTKFGEGSAIFFGRTK